MDQQLLAGVNSEQSPYVRFKDLTRIIVNEGNKQTRL